MNELAYKLAALHEPQPQRGPLGTLIESPRGWWRMRLSDCEWEPRAITAELAAELMRRMAAAGVEFSVSHLSVSGGPLRWWFDFAAPYGMPHLELQPDPAPEMETVVVRAFLALASERPEIVRGKE